MYFHNALRVLLELLCLFRLSASSARRLVQEVSTRDGVLGSDRVSLVQTHARWSTEARAGQRRVGHGSGQGEPELENDPASTTMTIGNLPIYGDGRIKPDGSASTWMLVFPHNFTRGMLLRACETLAAPEEECNYVGNPEQNGLPFISVDAPVERFRVSVLGTCTADMVVREPLCAARYAELDAPVRLFGSHYPMVTGRRTRMEGEEASVPWGVDRTDQRTGIDGEYSVAFTGRGVHVFHLDTGIMTSLEDFGGRALPRLDFSSKKAVACSAGDAECALDRHGHGTHTAGTIASRSYGIAKEATVHAVKVLTDSGFGSWAAFIGAIDWVVSYARKEQLERAVLSASLGGQGPTIAITEAVTQATNAGVVVVVAAGNDSKDACSFLPSSVKAAISVGSTEYDGGSDVKSSFSNHGQCVDIFAPGSDIPSLDIVENGEVMMSGTSMACPHVAGVIALMYEQDASLTAAKTSRALKHMATRSCIDELTPIGASANKLLYFGTDSAHSVCSRDRDE